MTSLEAKNKTLALLGVPPLRDENEQTHPGRTLFGAFELTKKAVLSEYPWWFALRIVDLAPVQSAPVPGWSYTFAYPVNAIALWDVFRPQRTPSAYDIRRVDFIVQNKMIYTNTIPVAVEHSVDVPFTQWDDAASEAFVYKLASDTAVKLVGNEDLSLRMLEKYRAYGMTAMRNTRNERQTEKIVSGSYVNVRRGGETI